MFLRRFYKAGTNYKRTYTDKYIAELIEKLGEEEAMRIDNATYALVLESKEEEKSWFFDCCHRIIANPRWYLDHLDNIPVFRVKIKEIFPEKIPDNRNLYK